ncbi:unnamed protein product [Ectocarpus fasciculatus]
MTPVAIEEVGTFRTLMRKITGSGWEGRRKVLVRGGEALSPRPCRLFFGMNRGVFAVFGGLQVEAPEVPGARAHMDVPPVHGSMCWRGVHKQGEGGGRTEEGLRIYWDFDKTHVSGSSTNSSSSSRWMLRTVQGSRCVG